MKKLLSFLLILIFLFSLCACNDNGNRVFVYDKTGKTDNIDSCQIDENDDFVLSYNSDKACVVLTDKTSKKQWSSLPVESAYDVNGRAAVTMGSPLYIEYKTSDSDMINTAYASTSAISGGRIDATLSDNKLTVMYFFDEFEIGVPVE
jgi:hypothetical protein